MPDPNFNRIPETDYLAVDDGLTGRQALELAGQKPWLVIFFVVGGFAVVSTKTLHAKLTLWRKLDTPLRDLSPAVLAPHLVESIQVEFEEDGLNLPRPEDRARLDELEEGDFLVGVRPGWTSIDPLVVLKRAGRQTRGIPGGKQEPYGHRGPVEPPGGDAPDIPFIKGPGYGYRDLPDSSEPFELFEEELSVSIRGLRGDAGPPAERFINVELLDSHSNPHDPETTPLQRGEVYLLAFDVDEAVREASIARRGAALKYQFGEAETEVTLTVRLETDDFEVKGGPERSLRAGSAGGPLEQAVFPIAPLHDGECLLHAVFLKDGNFIQVMTFKFTVGPLFAISRLGRGVDAAFGLQPRDVSLTILNTPAGFRLILLGPAVGATATLPVSPAELADMAEQARQDLLEMIDLEQAGKRPYQQMLDIPERANRQALEILAKAGLRLYQRIFFGPAADEQLKNLGRSLRELARRERLKIQIFSQDFVLPWGILYMAERFQPGEVDPELFLGMKHIIEHIPLQQGMLVTDNRMDGSRGLDVGLNLNPDIDRGFGFPLVSGQVTYWEGVGSLRAVRVQKRITAREVASALADRDNPEQVLYFYCHGEAGRVATPGGTDAAALVLSEDGRLTLEDLNLSAPLEDAFASAPLVFINACESARLSPLVYDGFVPYFIAKGARGVIGAECSLPALFAIEWARRFFDRFLEGQPLGQIFLDLRREFYYEHNNLLGLLYALYVDGDTRLDPPVPPLSG